MRPVTRSRIAVAVCAAVVALAWFRSELSADPGPMEPRPQSGGGGIGGGFGGMGGGQEEKSSSPTVVYIEKPITPESAATWIMLQKKIDLPFNNETSLEDFLKYVQSMTTDKDRPAGLSIYVDPVALADVEKTTASPISISLIGVRVETALRLVLKQLGLGFTVEPDGFLKIVSLESEEAGVKSPDEQILQRLESLQREILEIKKRLPPQPMGSVMGGEVMKARAQ